MAGRCRPQLAAQGQSFPQSLNPVWNPELMQKACIRARLQQRQAIEDAFVAVTMTDVLFVIAD